MFKSLSDLKMIISSASSYELTKILRRNLLTTILLFEC